MQWHYIVLLQSEIDSKKIFVKTLTWIILTKNHINFKNLSIQNRINRIFNF